MAESITDVATASNKQLLAVDDASKSMDVLMEKVAAWLTTPAGRL